ncbi:MAG: hypothetical protein QXR60_01605 [Candidatus Nanoarchaeia archaeon]
MEKSNYFLVLIEKRTFTTKGDYNTMSLPGQINLSENKIRAKVLFRIPYLGYLDIFHVGWLFRLVLVYLIACFLFLLFKK